MSFEEYNVQNVLNFLLFANQNFSVQHLNTIRSSIASVFKYVHPDQQPIATQPLIQDFFNSRRRKRTVKIPAEHELKTWDTDLIIQYIHTNLPNNTEISLTALQQKTIMLLLCIATMARPRSAIGNLQFQDVHLQYNAAASSLTGALIHFRTPKEAQVKSCTIGITQETIVCRPVTTLSIFVK